MIPGKIFKNFVKYKEKDNEEHIKKLDNLRILINDLVNNIYYPGEIVTSRLVYISKDARKLGGINNIK